MPRLFSSLKGSKSERTDLNPSATQFSAPPAYESHVSTSADNPPPYHNWQSVPDTALLPPPPSLPNEYSITSNASYDSAAKAHQWCERYPVYQPRLPSASLAEDVVSGRIRMDPVTKGYKGELRSTAPEQLMSDINGMPTVTYRLQSNTVAQLQTRAGLFPRATNTVPDDQIYLSTLPLYFAALNHPFSSNFASEKSEPFTIYFEIRPLSFNSEEATVAIGFAAKPYPPWRQPGWHRASLGVHSDDGRRFVNDPWGGVEFVDSFSAGNVLGLAMVFYPQHIITQDSKSNSPSRSTPASAQVRTGLQPVKTKVYFTRNGRVEGSWSMDEERDAEKDEGIEGLQGEADLYAAVGTFGDVDVEIRFFSHGSQFVPPP